MNIYGYQDQPTSLRQQTIYQRSYVRNIPSSPLQPYLDSRPASTKYSIMPIVDLREPIKTPLKQEAVYNPYQTFNPGNDTAPWSGYSSNINVESDLRNQVYALQNCSQAVYVPSSDSSLYNVKWQNSNKVQQPFPNLFKEQNFQQFNPNSHPNDIGYSLFNNATRQQLKDLTK